MARSEFGDAFADAYDGFLSPHLGELVDYYYADGTSVLQILAINDSGEAQRRSESVGALDNNRRVVYVISATDLVVKPTRGDYLFLSGSLDRWDVVDVRDGNTGEYLIHADRTLEEA